MQPPNPFPSLSSIILWPLVTLGFTALALANPTGPTVVNGSATFTPSGSTLQITNTPNTIINWRSFSIGASELTRFNQQSALSAVLNRVTTQNPSSILGSLQSNGRVFLINPNGIVFGAGSHVDVAGLVASTLNLSDTDFLSGRLSFTATPGAGTVVNNGTITTTGVGSPVYLVGPAVTNGGIITSAQGEVLLAAGNSVEIVEPGTPNLSVQISAPSNQALNLGSILADSGRIGIFSGLVRQMGVVQANTVVAGADGSITLKASGDVTLGSGSSTTALGPSEGSGGNLSLEGRNILISGTGSSRTQTVRATNDITLRGINQQAATLRAIDLQDIDAGRTLTLDARSGNAALVMPDGVEALQRLAATNIALRGGVCGSGCRNIAEIRNDAFGGRSLTTIRHGGSLLLENGANLLALWGGEINFESGGRLDLRGGTLGASISYGEAGLSIQGFPNITLSGEQASTRIGGEQLSVHARDVTLLGGEKAEGLAFFDGGFGLSLVVDRDLAMRAGAGQARMTTGLGTLQLDVRRNVTLQGGTTPDAQVLINGPELILRAGGNVTLQGGSGQNAHALISSVSDFGSNLGLTLGGVLRLQEGSGINAWAKIQTASPDSPIGLHFPNRSSDGWFVNGIRGGITDGSSGFFVGNDPAVLGQTLNVTYGASP